MSKPVKRALAFIFTNRAGTSVFMPSKEVQKAFRILPSPERKAVRARIDTVFKGAADECWSIIRSAAAQHDGNSTEEPTLSDTDEDTTKA